MRGPDDATKNAIAKAMRDALGSRSQKWLADQLDVDQTTVSQWLLGKTAPMFSRLSQIETALQMSPGTLRRLAAGEQENVISESAATYDVPTALGVAWSELDEEGRAHLLAVAEGLRAASRSQR